MSGGHCNSSTTLCLFLISTSVTVCLSLLPYQFLNPLSLFCINLGTSAYICLSLAFTYASVCGSPASTLVPLQPIISLLRPSRPLCNSLPLYFTLPVFEPFVSHLHTPKNLCMRPFVPLLRPPWTSEPVCVIHVSTLVPLQLLISLLRPPRRLFNHLSLSCIHL